MYGHKLNAFNSEYSKSSKEVYGLIILYLAIIQVNGIEVLLSVQLCSGT